LPRSRGTASRGAADASAAFPGNSNEAGATGEACDALDDGTDCAPAHTANAVDMAQMLAAQNDDFLDMTLSRLSESQLRNFRAAPAG
jgi:hypothetical protein